MIVRFYCDLYPWAGAQGPLVASNRPSTLTAGGIRVAFDVDFPPELLRECDAAPPVMCLPASAVVRA